MTGRTGSGKSTLARALLLSSAAPRLVIDPTHSELFDDPGFTLVREPHRLNQHADAATIRFVPARPRDVATYDAVFAWAWTHYPRWVLLDEAGVAAPARSAPDWLHTLVTQGRKRSIGFLACHTRPREVEPNLIAQAAHVFVFATGNPDDRRHLAGLMGCDPAVLTDQLAQLPEFGFLWWDQRRGRLVRCPPLRQR